MQPAIGRLVGLVSVAAIIAGAGCSQPAGEAADDAVESVSSGEHDSELVKPSEWWRVHPRPGYAELRSVGTFQDWYDVYELEAGTFAIYEPRQFEEAISYLVLGTERGVLVDTGTGIGDIGAVVDDLTDLPVSVVNTHAHYDHVGGDHYFDDVAIADVEAAVARLRTGRENSLLRGYVEDEFVWQQLPDGFDRESWEIPPIEPTRLLQDGDIIDLGGRELEVIATPGHSPGSICLLDAGRRILFTGDHFYPGPLYAHAADVDVDQYVASNARIADRVGEYDHVCSGHNEPWVSAAVIPLVSEAFATILSGEGSYAEDGGLRRYSFDGFDILIAAEVVTSHAAH